MDWETLNSTECVNILNADTRRGLSDREAQKRLKKNGKNELIPPKKKNLLLRFLSQFSDFMVIILLIAAAISFVTSYLQQDADYIDSIIILVIVVLNAFIGLVQESRAEKAIEALKKMSSPHACVLRGGKLRNIPASDLVTGDLVQLKSGDMVPADIRLLESHDLRCEESALTGESLPVEKNAAQRCPAGTALGDRKNMLFSSSVLTAGNGTGVVVATGMDTQVGKIAGMLSAQEAPKTPLQLKLAQTGRWLGLGALAICAVIFVMGLLQRVLPLDMFLISISLAVAAIPEGLPAVVTIVLAAGVKRMAAKKGIVRHMPAVETLGSASVICSDKTGTLTQNRMTVTELWTASGTAGISSADGQRVLALSALCNNSTQQNGHYLGEPTETALAEACRTDKSELDRQYPRVMEIAFSSSRKMMTTVHRLPDGRFRIISKGAPDVLLGRCQHTGVTAQAARKNEEMARRALRVIGVAVRDVANLPPRREDCEQGLSLLGLVGMIDPPRPGVKEAVETCKQAGIRPVMITGDHQATASAIAGELGILTERSAAITGKELDALPQQELEKRIYDYTVFARVSPEHKVRIVKAFQARGEVVAMTGDGVNDAPALKSADIGCAMGRGGTDVAKEAADLILADDNFTTIVAAVKEGRGIYDNIKKTIHFLLSCNIGEILTVFVGFLLGLPTPLLAIQLLWVNLVTDSLPALALGVEPIEWDIMKRSPAKKGESVFAGGMGYSILVEGCLIGSLSLLAFTIGRLFFDTAPANPIVGRTMAFAVLSLAQVAHTFNMRSRGREGKAAESRATRRSRLGAAAAICIALQSMVIIFPPLAAIFKVMPLSFGQWAIVAGLSLLPLLLGEVERRWNRRKRVDSVKQQARWQRYKKPR
ncbi:calcium-translocating P-type ATPase, PMCA-type [Hydrogeniiclostridium mannosilyticum]|uniref:P-type Ca(2+) transporter n=1 Tax=Hydrogeniiclostridium mannosilyticum TaxID=2764322 RepID=A0A328U9P7_9FIRM|nr:calcium-translocating P-type ATPase, PMCA-type [Hydrogeniiclostridium mannosilyticum]MBS6162648.1 calcium-translocating P-type ATPase, PMCA-type [Clostridiales bacterium]RAQ22777.1 calcium-translocating P-type ATPase, PMCA-type [Hydrogeniiclostridium mannosilyticum]